MSRSASLGVLLDHAQDKVVLLDEAGRFTYANEAVRRILGWDPDAIVGENAFDYVHPEDVQAARAAFRETISVDEFTDTTGEFRFRAADGSWVWLESRMSNLTDDHLDGYVVSSRDVSDRVEAQRERQRMASRLRELTTATGDVLWMFDSDFSELLFVNPAYEDVFGRPVEELESDPDAFLDAIHPGDRAAVEDAMACLSGGESVDLEYRVNPRKDYGVWVWVQAEPIVEDGEVVRVTGFVRDITDRHRRERQLYVMDNLLRHNLRNDVGIILGNAELIEEEAPEVADRTEIIRRTGEGLLASAEKEREIIEVLTSDIAPERVDLAETVRHVADVVRQRFPGVSVDVSVPETANVHALNQVTLVVAELLENAVVHSKSEDPSVEVTVRREAETVTLTVADDAPPIPETELRVLTGDHEMSAVYHSTGLGLWLTHWVVDLSEGRVDVDTGDDTGNRIHVTLPRVR